MPLGYINNSSLILILPSNNVPVIIVPNPFTENTLSILSLDGESSFLLSIALLISSILFISLSMP